MRSIRKLFLQNASGQRWGLNGENGVYCTDLSGFGFTLGPTFGNVGQGFFFQESEDAETQMSIPFTLVFTKSPYETYQMFCDWLAAAGKLSVVYNPTSKKEYLRDVSVSFIQKGELTRVGWLEIPCSFNCLTPWFLPTPTVFAIHSSGEDERKRYSYRYTDSLKYGMDSSAALSATIAGAGHMPGAIEVTYFGAIKNPQIKLIGNISGRTLGVCSIAAVLESTDVLKFSTKYESSGVKKISASGIETDLLDAIDLSLMPFFHIPVNEPCTVSIESDDFFVGSAEMSVYYYYRSV